ncbi:dihydroxyacetone kinase subunit DhaL [Sporolituus thermophilus]|uniref:phosphoenolpyruvate--glycerone phosphotransferase n=1 Tax=Sporolituus thermophilus DSM 23256 TaxID=1123285 RepID=A0A1G7L9H9_9FIRM|nr:dihydroxyacetone kinase subunit DhaL [Sporolituus thermophilus]SDF46036.1 dihydroxyacetone kinase DhaL subunit [Sporolituus thermophilus DSM 23256]
MTQATVVAAIQAVGEAIIAQKQFLTDLDAAIGDADHGINMARGFEQVIAKLSAATNEIGATLKLVGMTLISTVGGASGPLYGTAFLRAAAASQGKTNLDRHTAQAMFAAAVNGIKERGKATSGDKTMLDALEPALAAFADAIAAGKSLPACLDAACTAAYGGVEYTKTIPAAKGRASYLGERSIGHQDPGATSSYLMLKALADFCRQTKLDWE